MAGIKSIADRKDEFWINPLLLREEPGWNVRDDTPALREHIRELADSIKEVGVKQPLTVRMDGDVPIVTDGHCRLAAVNLALSEGAEIKRVPVRVEDRHATPAEHIFSMLVRNGGKPLTPHEMARPVRQLLDFGWTSKEICAKTGFSPSKLQDILALSSASPAVTEMIVKGEVSPTTAARAIRKHGAKDGEKRIEEAVEKAKDEGKTKASINDVIPKDSPSLISIYNDGFAAGVIHALAVLAAAGFPSKAHDVRAILLPSGVNMSLAGVKDRMVLQETYEDLQ